MTAAILVFSFLAFAFSSIVMMPAMKGPFFGKSEPVKNSPMYEPPKRHSIIVDHDGLAHPTADLTHPTKRDRSRWRTVWAPNAQLDIFSGESAPSASVTPTALPAPPAAPQPEILKQPPVRALSAGRRIKAWIATDPEISRLTRSSVRVHSSHGRVTMWGQVMDANEKARLHSIATRVAGFDNVDDRLEVV